jgi:hypothetical protein
MKDNEGNAVTATVTDENNNGTPLYVTSNATAFSVTPTYLNTGYGVRSIKVILSDGLLSTTYNFAVNITNSAPYYMSISGNKLADISINNNQTANITLPDIGDDLVPISVTQTLSPSLPWISIVQNANS